MPNPFENPFDPATDQSRHDLWNVLVARDSEAFAAADWSICDGDFSHERFEGISAHNSLDPMDWSLRYPTVAHYRDDWLAMARRFSGLPLATISHRELLYKMQTLARCEITKDRAIVWKHFHADEPLSSGEHYRLSAQSVYRLHRIDGAWLIVGFVGYLPLGRPA